MEFDCVHSTSHNSLGQRRQQQTIGKGKHAPVTVQSNISIQVNHRNEYTDPSNSSKMTKDRSKIIAPWSSDPQVYGAIRGLVAMTCDNDQLSSYNPSRGGLKVTDIHCFTAMNGIPTESDISFLGLVTNAANTEGAEGNGAVQIFGTGSTINPSRNFLPAGCTALLDAYNPDIIRTGLDDEEQPGFRIVTEENGVSHVGLPADKYLPSVKKLQNLHTYPSLARLDKVIMNALNDQGLQFFIPGAYTGSDDAPMAWQEYLQSTEKLHDRDPLYHYACVSVAWYSLQFTLKHCNKGGIMQVTSDHVIYAYNLCIDMIQDYETREDETVKRESSILLLENEQFERLHPVYNAERLSDNSEIESLAFLRLVVEMADWVKNVSMNVMDRHHSYLRKRIMGTVLNNSHGGGQLDLALKLVR